MRIADSNKMWRQWVKIRWGCERKERLKFMQICGGTVVLKILIIDWLNSWCKNMVNPLEHEAGMECFQYNYLDIIEYILQKKEAIYYESGSAIRINDVKDTLYTILTNLIECLWEDVCRTEEEKVKSIEDLINICRFNPNIDEDLTDEDATAIYEESLEKGMIKCVVTNILEEDCEGGGLVPRLV